MPLHRQGRNLMYKLHRFGLFGLYLGGGPTILMAAETSHGSVATLSGDVRGNGQWPKIIERISLWRYPYGCLTGSRSAPHRGGACWRGFSLSVERRRRE